MNNQKGNAIALVLLILAVVSLVGAGALMMSKYDLRFSHALRSYDMSFNLADGAATISYRDLAKHDREQTQALRSDYQQNLPVPQTIYCQCKLASECSSTPVTCPSGRCVDRTAGDYNSQVQIVDYRTSQVSEGAGWEAGSYYNENWNGLGVSQRASQRSLARAALGQSDPYQTGNTTVQANVLKKKRTGN